MSILTICLFKPTGQMILPDIRPYFKFSLNDIKKNGKLLTVTFLVESKSDESKFELSTYVTRIFDNLGNEYRPGAGKTAHFEIGNSTTSVGTGLGNTIVKGIPTKVVIRFSGIDEKASKITLMEIGGNKDRKIQIRDISILG